MTRISIEIDEEQKRQIKVLAALNNLSLKDFILEKTIGSEPNAETVKSFNDYQKKKNLKGHNNFNQFLKDLNR